MLRRSQLAKQDSALCRVSHPGGRALGSKATRAWPPEAVTSSYWSTCWRRGGLLAYEAITSLKVFDAVSLVGLVASLTVIVTL
jgi:hypothetical protein